MKGCAFCGHHEVLRLGRGTYAPEAYVVVCDACGARGPSGETQEEAERLYEARHMEGRVGRDGLALGALIGALAATVVLGLCANRARQESARALDEAYTLTEQVEARAFERGQAAARRLALAEREVGR